MATKIEKEGMANWHKGQIIDCCKYIIKHIDEIYDGEDSGLHLIIKCFPDRLVELNTIHHRFSTNCTVTKAFKPFDDCGNYEITKQIVLEAYEKYGKERIKSDDKL